MSLGIDFDTILAPLWHQIPCVGVIVFGNDFSCDCYINCNEKNSLFFSWESIKASIFVEPVPQLVFLKVPWLTLAPFCFGSCWSFGFTFGCILAAFGHHLVIIFMILDHFVANVGPSGACSLSTPFSVEAL